MSKIATILSNVFGSEKADRVIQHVQLAGIYFSNGQSIEPRTLAWLVFVCSSCEVENFNQEMEKLGNRTFLTTDLITALTKRFSHLCVEKDQDISDLENVEISKTHVLFNYEKPKLLYGFRDTKNKCFTIAGEDIRTLFTLTL